MNVYQVSWRQAPVAKRESYCSAIEYEATERWSVLSVKWSRFPLPPQPQVL